MGTLLIVPLLIALLAGPAFAQAPASAPRSNTDAQTPIYRVTVVGRTTAAITYRPQSGETKVDFVATAALPTAKGVADVSGKKGYIAIDARFEQLPAASLFGPEYLTYVLWAMTPEGRPKNLGELQVHEGDARIHVTTDLQAFAMIVTVEPYFAVTQPSEIVVLENVARDNTDGSVEAVHAKYELLKRGSYLRDQAAAFGPTPLAPGTPLDLAEARNAVALARIAGADRYASDSFAKATRLLQQAESALAGRKQVRDVMMPARQAAQTAEDARLIAVERQEAADNARQRVASALRERDALQRVESEEARRKAAEESAAAARTNAERERREREQARLDALRTQSDADQAVALAEANKEAAIADAHQARLDTLRTQAALAVAEQEKNTLRQQLRDQLNAVLETRENARGLITNVPDVLFDTASARLTAEAREKLARIAGILAAQPDLRIAIEGHTDNVGRDDENQQLSERRARSVLDYLVEQKVPLAAADTAGFGKTRPIASNDTPAGRKQNRRVEIVVMGESIGRSGEPAQ